MWIKVDTLWNILLMIYVKEKCVSEELLVTFTYQRRELNISNISFLKFENVLFLFVYICAYINNISLVSFSDSDLLIFCCINYVMFFLTWTFSCVTVTYVCTCSAEFFVQDCRLHLTLDNPVKYLRWSFS